MFIQVSTAEQIGTIAHAERRRQRLRQDDFAAMVGSSHVFLRDMERGKPGVQLGRVLLALQELGIRVYLDVPQGNENVDVVPTVKGVAHP